MFGDFGHGLVKSRVEHGHHRSGRAQDLPGPANPCKTRGIVQRRQLGQSVNSSLNFVSNQRRLHVSISSMHYPMPDRFDVVERTGQTIEQNMQRMRMVPNLQCRRRTVAVRSCHLEACDPPDAFDNSLEQRRPTCQRAPWLLNHVHEPKFDRRAPAVDDQDLHINVEVSRHAPGCCQSSFQSEPCAAASAPDFLPSKALVYLPTAAAPLHFAR